MEMRLSNYHVVTQPFFDGLEKQVKRILFSTRTGMSYVTDTRIWDLVKSGSFELMPQDQLDELINAQLLVPADEDELQTILKQNNAAIKQNEALSIVVQPTAYCQLGCGYCGQKHSPKWLTAKHQDELLARIKKKLDVGKFTHLEIGWFGAEPLSGLQVIRTLTPKLRSLALAADCTYGASIVTNGLGLTEKVATEIVNEHGIGEINVTIDGDAQYHDARRQRKNGTATFQQIFFNVVALAKRDDLNVSIKLRSNVDQGNCDGISPLLRLLAKEGVQKRISYYVAPVHSWGNDADKTSLSPQDFAAHEINWFCEMIELGFKVGFLPSRRRIVCLAVESDSELIDATGTLFNCTEVSYVPSYGHPNKFTIGHVSTGELSERRNLLGDFNDRVERGDYPCTSCRMLPVCGGACPKAWLEGNEPCPSAKKNIEERLLLSYAASRSD